MNDNENYNVDGIHDEGYDLWWMFVYTLSFRPRVIDIWTENYVDDPDIDSQII